MITHTIQDGARLERELDMAKRLNNDHVSLYKGRPEEELAGVAPYLFLHESRSDFSNWVAHNGLGNSWGIYLHSPAAMEAVQKHLRRFLMVQMEDTGKQVYFRFYDPRVLRIFLPTCDTQQLAEMFGQVITRFVCEDEDPAFALVFSLRNGRLHTERLAAATVFPALNDPPIDVSPLKAEMEREYEEATAADAAKYGGVAIETGQSQPTPEVLQPTPVQATEQASKQEPNSNKGTNKRFRFLE